MAVLTALAALALVLDARVQAQESTQGPACGGIEVGKTGAWSIINAPEFSVGDPEIVAHAVDPRTGVWFITNGKVIMVSEPGPGLRAAGCTWRESYVVPEQPDLITPFPREAAKIVRIEASGGLAVATIVGPSNEQVTNPLDGQPLEGPLNTFIATSDTGRGWARTGDPAVPVGDHGPFIISARNPSKMYVAIGGLVWRSDDGGTTWGAKPFSGGNGLPALDVERIEAMALDPDEQDRVWASDGTSIWFTEDGGESWTNHDVLEGAGSLEGLAVNKPIGGQTRMVAMVVDESGEATGAVVSTDAGKSYKVEKVEDVAGRVTGLGANLNRPDWVITTEDQNANGTRQGAYRGFPGKGKLDDIDEFDLSPMFGPEVVELRNATFFHSFSVLYIHREPPPVETLPPSGEPPPIPPARPADLQPAAGDVRVEPGGSSLVDYKLNLPEQPTPIDVYFLLDTSGSTDPYIKGLQEGLGEIASTLDKNDIAAGYGLGEYQDTVGMRYRRRVNIGPTDALKRSLAAIRTAGGEEPGYTALHQAATGTGIPTVKTGRPVDKDQAPTWRQGTVRVVVQVADEPYAEDADGPTKAQAIAALKNERMQVIGVQVTDNPPGPGATASCPVVLQTRDTPNALTLSNPSDNPVRALRLRCQMEEIARETGALAPEGGVDCNGDSQVDLQEGQPLVCTLRREGTAGNKVVAMAKPLVELLKGIKDEQEVKLVPEPSEIKVEVTPGGNYTRLNLKLRHLADFKMQVSCTLEQAGKIFPLTINAKAGVRTVGTAKPRVLCGDPPAVPAVVPPVKRKEQPAQAPAQVAQSAQMPVGAGAQQKETQITPAYVDLNDGDDADAEGPAELHSGDLYFSAGEDPGRPGGPEWIFRLLGVTAVLAAAVVLAPGNRRAKQAARRRVRA